MPNKETTRKSYFSWNIKVPIPKQFEYKQASPQP